MSSVILSGLNVFLAPQNLGIDTKIIKFEWIVSDLWLSICMYFGGHFGRHVEKSLFQCFDLGKLLVCYKVRLMLIESIEKHFLAVFGGQTLFWSDYAHNSRVWLKALYKSFTYWLNYLFTELINFAQGSLTEAAIDAACSCGRSGVVSDCVRPDPHVCWAQPPTLQKRLNRSRRRWVADSCGPRNVNWRIRWIDLCSVRWRRCGRSLPLL